MSTFSVSNSDEAIDAVNYLLSNLPSQAITANVASGAISVPDQTLGTSYLYQYMAVRYATAADGSTGFSTSPTNATYYGLRNSSTSTGSSDPADYVWTQVTGGFGTTKSLFYTTWGGRQVLFVVATAAPDSTYLAVTDGVSVDLDVILGTKIAANSVGTNQLEDSAVTNIKIAADAVTANKIVAGTITATEIAANTITGDNIAAGTITADKLAANAITANTVVSTGATLGDNNSVGFWLDGTTGNARFGNSLSVGNFLSVGNNATIGGNLAVSGLITSGALDANTVITTTITPSSISSGVANSFSGSYTVTSPVDNQYYYIGNTSVTTQIADEPLYVWSDYYYDYTTSSTINPTDQILFTYQLGYWETAGGVGGWTNLYSLSDYVYPYSSEIGFNNTHVTFPAISLTVPVAASYTFAMRVKYQVTSGTIVMNDGQWRNINLLTLGLKR